MRNGDGSETAPLFGSGSPTTLSTFFYPQFVPSSEIEI